MRGYFSDREGVPAIPATSVLSLSWTQQRMQSLIGSIIHMFVATLSMFRKQE